MPSERVLTACRAALTFGETSSRGSKWPVGSPSAARRYHVGITAVGESGAVVQGANLATRGDGLA